MSIDLNADLGEGFGIWRLGDDEALLDVITSANVACGFHAGDPTIMRRVCEQAIARGVRIGAQVGYRDLAGFGRRRIEVDADDLSAEVSYQLGALDGFARAAGDRVRYLKPHGALYHAATTDPAQAAALVDAVGRHDGALTLLGPPTGELADAANAAGLDYVVEGFADRGYRSDGRLVARGEAGALHADGAAAVAQALSIARDQVVTGVDGDTVSVPARSVCVHGDTPQAAELAHRIRRALAEAGIALEAFT